MSKAAKLIYFTAKSQEHDVNIKLKSIMRWLKSGHEVRVRIEGSAERHRAMENIYKQLEKDIKQNATFLQRVVKPDSIKFVLKPSAGMDNIELNEQSESSVEIDQLSNGKDLLSEEFEKELEQSIMDELSKKK